jgi:SAM-dependent methyltransferase
VVPARIAWAVELVHPQPADRVLEIGCGPGVAAGLVADRLSEGGYIVAIDRSAAAIARAGARNASHVASGRLVLEQVALADFQPDGRLDKAFGVNVNLFWTTSAAPECDMLLTALTSGGTLHLVYDGPGGPRTDAIERVVANLTRQGFTATVGNGPDPSVVCVRAAVPA